MHELIITIFANVIRLLLRLFKRSLLIISINDLNDLRLTPVVSYVCTFLHNDIGMSILKKSLGIQVCKHIVFRRACRALHGE